MRLTQTGLEPVQVPRFEQNLDLESVAVVPLETTWRFKTDPQRAGTGDEWFAPDVPDSDWAPIRTDRNWQAQGYQDYHGSAWYRTGLTLPQDFDTRKHLWLFFESVDSEAYVYVDGTKVFEHTFASNGPNIWNTPFRVDARPLLKPGCEHLIAVRVDSEDAAGGIWRPVCLISTDSEAPPAVLRAILRERSLQ
jgi:beta-galactosidase/beta-glucuronidase